MARKYEWKVDRRRIFDGLPVRGGDRPKGMHRSTFERLTYVSRWYDIEAGADLESRISRWAERLLSDGD